jgi:hypothetical protein
MNDKNVVRVVLSLFLVVIMSSSTFDVPVLKYSPVGSWEYSVPGVQAGYEAGTMTIIEEGKGYKVTLQLNEYFKADAEKVIYKKKNLSFSILVENEEILVSGTFDGDRFTAKLSYSEGEFDLTALRKAAE